MLDVRHGGQRAHVGIRVERLEQQAARARPRPDRRDPVVEHLLAAVDHDEVVAQQLGVDHHVRREDHGRPALVLLADEIAQQPLVERIESAERLIEDDEVGAMDDRG